jgi:hypothetical protein
MRDKITLYLTPEMLDTLQEAMTRAPLALADRRKTWLKCWT